MKIDIPISINKNKAIDLVCDRFGKACLAYIFDIKEEDVVDFLSNDDKDILNSLFEAYVYCLEPST